MKIAFRFNQQKAIEIVLYLMSKNPYLDQQKLQHLVFDADIYHLNTHGRPLLGDEYFKEGKYIVSKNISCVLAQTQILSSPYLRLPNLDYLSSSDVKALDRTLSKSDDHLLSIQDEGLVDYESLVIDEEATDFLKKFSGSMVI